MSIFSILAGQPPDMILWYPAGSPNARSPNGGSPNSGLPKQYRHGGLPKRHFAKSLVPRTVLG
jgi:hypothetical protein